MLEKERRLRLVPKLPEEPEIRFPDIPGEQTEHRSRRQEIRALLLDNCNIYPEDADVLSESIEWYESRKAQAEASYPHKGLDVTAPYTEGTSVTEAAQKET
jgi:hypothetical protein